MLITSLQGLGCLIYCYVNYTRSNILLFAKEFMIKTVMGNPKTYIALK